MLQHFPRVRSSSHRVGSRLVSGLAALVVTCVMTARAPAGVEYVDPVVAGEGFNFAYVQVEFFEGDAYLFEVHFSDAPSGFGLLEILANDPRIGFDLEYTAFPFGNFVTGLGFDGLFESGDGSNGNDFWHYWVRDDQSDDWMAPPFGPDDRVVSHGTWDGWVFGRSDEPTPLLPVPAPGAAALFAVVAVIGSNRGRRRA